MSVQPYCNRYRDGRRSEKTLSPGGGCTGLFQAFEQITAQLFSILIHVKAIAVTAGETTWNKLTKTGRISYHVFIKANRQPSFIWIVVNDIYNGEFISVL